MQCYSELVPPSGVTHALSVPFTAANASNLILGRTSLLQIYSPKQTNQGQSTRLVLVAEYNLPGTITSLGRVKIRNPKSGGEAILVALRDAKLSLVEWDPNQHSISTISIHYYEHYDLHAAPWSLGLADSVSHLTVDPRSRCAAFNFGVSNLAIIPFHQLGDDLAMDDYDELDDEGNGLASATAANGHARAQDTPYAPSFVLPLTTLDPGLLHPIDMAFLHEYRDPTIGILYSSAARSANMAPERRDVTIYAVYALDLEQKASTTLQSVQKLPNDLYRVIALPLPVGGALLIGGNELIHIDQGGKTTAIGVNEFARECSSFPMVDHSAYRMRLEGCQIQALGNARGDMLVVLATGDVAVLSFRLDGRSLTGMSLHRIEPQHVSSLVKTAASCMAHIGLGRVFVGSEDSESVLVATAKRPSLFKRQSSRAQAPLNGHSSEKLEDDGSSEEEAEGEEEDDLYGSNNNLYTTNGEMSADGAPVSGQNFHLLDLLPCIAPIHDVTFGRPSKRKRDPEDESEDLDAQRLDLAVACGRGRAGGLAFFSRRLEPRILKRIRKENLTGVWCFSTNVRDGTSPHAESTSRFDDHIILSQRTGEGAGQSSLHTLSGGQLYAKDDTEFDGSAGATIAVGGLATSNHTVQVTANEVRVYDADFGLSQIFPIFDEEEGQLAKVSRASVAEPYIVIFKDDKKMMLLKADRAGELDEVELPDAVREKSILSACIYQDSRDFFQSSRFYDTSPTPPDISILVVLTSEGHFCMLSLPNVAIQIFQCESLPFLPTQLGADVPIPKHWRTKDDLTEALLADLGDAADQQPCLVVRNTLNDIIMYQPFAVPDVVGTFKFKKIANRAAEMTNETALQGDGGNSAPLSPMHALEIGSAYAAIFVPEPCPAIILKRASSMPHIYQLRAHGIRSISALHSDISDRSFALIDERGDLCIAEIPSPTIFGDSDWLVEKVELGQDITSLAYFAPAQSYVLATHSSTEFQLPQDDEWHPEWQNEKTSFLPTTTQSALKLLSSKTHSIISQHHFEPSERILCVQSLNLEISEETHERKDMIVVGTAIIKGENVVTRGNLYIFDVVEVVPEPDVPETDLKLKLITKEDVRGAVTAVSEVGSQGFLLAAQGQKCMVRGLKEDMSILPVAFMDMRYYVKVAKDLPGTGLCILGDAFSGLWLMGYSEEPYKMQLLGRDLANPEVLAAEFLPDGKQLFIISSDGDGQLRVLQYDPENPKTERGAKLLLRSTFNTGALPTTMTLLPRTPVSSEASHQVLSINTTTTSSSSSPDASNIMDLDATASASSSNYARHQILLTTQEGSLALLTPLSEQSYRLLSTLQNILFTTLDHHPCGLNPRAHRRVETDGLGGRGLIDGNLVRRWSGQSTPQQSSTADKAGASVWEVRGDLEAVSGRGLGYL